MKVTGVKGFIYEKRGRWYWRKDKKNSIPLKLPHQRYATKNKSTAVELVLQMVAKVPKHQDFDGKLGTLVALYKKHTEQYYRHLDGTPTKEVEDVKFAMRYLEQFAELNADEITPHHIIRIQDSLIGSNLARSTINQRIDRLKRLFKWAASRCYISGYTYYAISAIEGIKFGRGGKETEPVRPAAEEAVYGVRPYTSMVVADMVEFEYLTGARPTELCIMRPCDIDRSGKTWVYNLPKGKHKTAHHGHDRFIPIGPRAQEILAPYLERDPKMYCFSPKEAKAQHLNRRRQKRIIPDRKGTNMPGTNKKDKPKRAPRDRYDASSYWQAVDYAYKKAKKAGETFKKFSPNQLRHSTSTRIVNYFGEKLGLEYSSKVLGHDIEVTKIYAERDLSTALQVAREIG